MADNSHLILQYQEQSVSTMSKGDQLVLLYDELIKSLKHASILFGQGQDEQAKKRTAKARNIVNYLYAILDDRYGLSAELKRIYSHLLTQIIRANVSGDAKLLDAEIPSLQGLRDAWAQAEKSLRKRSGAKGKERAAL